VEGVKFREYQAEIWSEKFGELCEFRQFHGHCHVPLHYSDNDSLAQWVKRQRYQYKLKITHKKSTLSEERVRLLNKISFIWNSHDAVWEERLQDLVGYKKVHGHCMVPSSFESNPQLAVWTKRQRRQYKKYQEWTSSSMTPARIAKLENIGFVWDCRKVNKVDGIIREMNMQDVVVGTTGVTATAASQKSSSISSNSTATAVVGFPKIADTGNSDRFNNEPLSAEKQQQQQQQPLRKTPRCEFFSFSQKYTPDVGGNSQGDSRTAIAAATINNSVSNWNDRVLATSIGRENDQHLEDYSSSSKTNMGFCTDRSLAVGNHSYTNTAVSTLTEDYEDESANQKSSLSSSMTTAVGLSSTNHEPLLLGQEQPIRKTPRCEFFSFSRK